MEDGLRRAAEQINSATLTEAKAAIAATCSEYLQMAERLSISLESVPTEKLHRFARALSLTILGHLPVRPQTCPFCIQYGRDRSCTGCGYARTHGRCDDESSAFSIFIEAFQELGRVIYQETGALSCPESEARAALRDCIRASMDLTRMMQEEIKEASTEHLMEQKAAFISEMIRLLPVQLFGEDVAKRRRTALDALKRYW